MAEEAKKEISVARSKNNELTRTLEDAEKKVDQLQDSVQRSVTIFHSNFFFFGQGGRVCT